MALGVLDSAIFADMFGTPAMRGIFGDEAFLARCIDVEAALARAQARLGIIPAEAGEAITRAAGAFANGESALDLARLRKETETVGYPILPLVRRHADGGTHAFAARAADHFRLQGRHLALGPRPPCRPAEGAAAAGPPGPIRR